MATATDQQISGQISELGGLDVVAFRVSATRPYGPPSAGLEAQSVGWR